MKYTRILKFDALPGGPRFGIQGQDKDILNDMGPRDANTMPIHANGIHKTRGWPPSDVLLATGRASSLHVRLHKQFNPPWISMGG